MKQFFERIAETVIPTLGMLIFVTLLILAIFFLSYVFIIIGIIGFILFAIGYVRARILMHKQTKAYEKRHKGRTIDHK